MSIEITAKQIKEIDELRIEEQALREMISVNLQYYENRLGEIIKGKDAWWDEMGKIYDIDFGKELWQTKRVAGVASIVKKDQ